MIDVIFTLDDIETSEKEWASMILFTLQKNGIFHFWVGYCKLDAMTIRDSNRIMNMDKCTDFVGDARYLQL